VTTDSDIAETTPPTPSSSLDAPFNVLVIDDDPAIRCVFQSTLKDSDCVVSTAEHARQALQILMREGFDVLIVDLKMEGMDGIIFIQEALKIWPWLGVVIASAFIDDYHVQQARALGVSRILEKPISAETLIETVHAEGHEKKALASSLPGLNALALMRDHLRLLNELEATAISSETLVGTLLEFGKTLARLLPSNVVGILVRNEEEEEPELLLYARTPVNDTFLKHVEKEMLTRYAVLCGECMPLETLNIRMEGESSHADAPVEVTDTLSVPIIIGDTFCGLLTLAAAKADTYATSDVSLLYYAANHISAVFVALRRMHFLATRDHLTGVFNRIRMEEELERAWLQAKRYNRSMSAVVLDIDNFKTYNDSYGHNVGDRILRDMAALLTGEARASDVVARFGGDEFVIILPESRPIDARAFSERLLERLRAHVFCEGTTRMTLTASIGVASLDSPDPPTTRDQLLAQADRALYIAKRAGRDRLVIWPGPTASEVETDAEAPGRQKKSDHILIVDDEGAVLELVNTMLKRKGFETTTAGSASEALQAIQEHTGAYDMLLTDLSMPGKSGVDLLHEVTSLDDSIVKIVMTGYATVDTAVECLREGAYDFIQKPIRLGELVALIGRASEYRSLRIENARYQAHLEEMVRERSAQLAATLEEVKRSHRFTLDALVAMLDARESQTGQHSVRARDLTVHLAHQFGIEGDELEVIASGAFLHDIGKIGVPDAILLKEGPLDDDEWVIMKSHCEIGYNILRLNPYMKQAAEIVHHHHEQFDGSGYPRGLKEEQICLGARLFSIIDAYDAMRSHRCYRRALSVEQAIDEIESHSGSQFDPQLVKVFLENQPEIEDLLHRH
jgi:diguanylate cyclase (GGDEF)-like protein/putative nucleotidyltransferase with HDIG domain